MLGTLFIKRVSTIIPMVTSTIKMLIEMMTTVAMAYDEYKCEK